MYICGGVAAILFIGVGVILTPRVAALPANAPFPDNLWRLAGFLCLFPGVLFAIAFLAWIAHAVRSFHDLYDLPTVFLVFCFIVSFGLMIWYLLETGKPIQQGILAVASLLFGFATGIAYTESRSGNLLQKRKSGK